MKRLALLSAVSLMLASAIFAPVAMAQEVAEVDVQSLTLGPGGSVIATGTIQCFQDWRYTLQIDVRQRSGQGYNQVSLNQSRICNGSVPTSFTVSGFAQKPLHGGKATAQTFSIVQDTVSGSSFVWEGPIEAVRLH